MGLVGGLLEVESGFESAAPGFFEGEARGEGKYSMISSLVSFLLSSESSFSSYYSSRLFIG